MMPSGHKAFLVSNTKDVELLLMHNRTYAAEYVVPSKVPVARLANRRNLQDCAQCLVPKADRHHRPSEATGSQGHEPEGEGDD